MEKFIATIYKNNKKFSLEIYAENEKEAKEHILQIVGEDNDKIEVKNFYNPWKGTKIGIVLLSLYLFCFIGMKFALESDRIDIFILLSILFFLAFAVLSWKVLRIVMFISFIYFLLSLHLCIPLFFFMDYRGVDLLKVVNILGNM